MRRMLACAVFLAAASGVSAKDKGAVSKGLEEFMGTKPSPVAVGGPDMAGDAIPKALIVKEEKGAVLFTNAGALTGKTASYHLLWVFADAVNPNKALHVFSKPFDGSHPLPPAEVFLTRRRVKVGGKKAVQIWKYGGEGESPAYGMFAAAYDMKEGKAQRLRPLLWWGMPQGQELDQYDPEILAERAGDGSLFKK